MVIVEQVCYIVSAMSVPDLTGLKREGCLLIAADAGFATLQRQEVLPDLVVGDFDSLGVVPEHPCVVRHPVEKDDTDTLLAAGIGVERGYKKFIFFGALGGLLDHTMANCQTLLWLAERGAEGYLLGEGQCVAVIKSGGKLRFSPENHGRISVFAAGDRAEGVTIRGLRYELERGCLTNSFPLGVSNAFVGREAEIAVAEGALFVLWQQEEMKAAERLLVGGPL